MELTGKILNGKFIPDDVMLYYRATKRLEGKKVILSLKEDKPSRSNALNRYYWGVVIKYFIVGYEELNGEIISSEEAHDFLKQQFNLSLIHI